MKQKERPTNLIITGVGGQGNVLAARLLASTALKAGYEVTVGDVFGLTQRGGSVASHIRWVNERALPPLVPQGTLDVLIAFEPLEAIRVLTGFGQEKTVAVINDTPIMPIGVQQGRFNYPHMDELREGLKKLTYEFKMISATTIAKELGNLQALNMVMMGALFGSGYINLDALLFEEAIKTTIPGRFHSINLSAFEIGIERSSNL